MAWGDQSADFAGFDDVNSEHASCLICDADNPSEAVVCKQCSAPMALTKDSVGQGRDPRIVSIVGESNVGKTVYLGFLLDMLSQRAGGFEAIPKGAYSIDLQQNVIANMSKRRFPGKTAMEPNQWYWTYYQVRRMGKRSKWFDLVMPDIAGEALAAEVDTPHTFPVIEQVLGKSAGTMMLLDAALAGNGQSRPDFFAMKMMSYIDTMFADSRSGKLKKPVAVVLCKSDHCPESFDNPRRFVEANLNRLWNLCESRFEKVEYFACSAVGSLGYATAQEGESPDFVQPIPLHTSLQGILEPFTWLVDQI
ncbi:MAG: ribosomal protein L40E [Hyphomicrobiaceae bacterium]|jgi:ribosomal protein L40E